MTQPDPTVAQAPPAEAVSGESSPGSTVSRQSSPGSTVSRQSSPGSMVSSQSIPGQRQPSGLERAPGPGQPGSAPAYRPTYQPVPTGGWPVAPGTPYPINLPPRPRPSRHWSALAMLVFLSAAIALAGAAGAATTLRVAPTGQTHATWVDATRPEVRTPALTALLTRRTSAVLTKDKVSFMADVDAREAAFVKRQETVYANLTKLQLAQLRFELEPSREYPGQVPADLRERYGGLVRAVGVTIRYTVADLDSKPVTAPWVPIFGYADGRWLLVGEASDKDLPGGTNGQAWDAGPIAVVRTKRVVVVVSADDADRGPTLAHLAERALDQVAEVRPSGWDGKVLITAVQDQQIFDSYFVDSPDRVRRVAAIAVPYYDRIPEWHRQAITFATTRVVFNPKQLLAPASVLEHDLAHEFAHAAMGPITTGYTPRWLVEGFAEYVSYKGKTVRPADLREALNRLKTDGGLRDGEEFYTDGANYVGAWLACQMIVEQFGGEAKLIALYEQFRTVDSADRALSAVLGVDGRVLNDRWRTYVQRRKG